MQCAYPKSVSVCAYVRFRKGKLEVVAAHCRATPTK